MWLVNNKLYYVRKGKLLIWVLFIYVEFIEDFGNLRYIFIKLILRNSL